MSGFDKTWLALREPVDQRSRDLGLLEQAAALLNGSEVRAVFDIGCGTGSTYRSLSPKIGWEVSWTLLDHDAGLLAEAARRHPAAGLAFLRSDLNDLAALPLAGKKLVTASAFFDLCSTDYIFRLVERMAEEGIALYAALNYDGGMHWSVKHPLDQAVMHAFNKHQQTDKGFGAAAGPQAWRDLSQLLRERGYSVTIAASPWLMGRDDADLQREFLQGVVRAVREGGALHPSDLTEWHSFRLESIPATASLCRVGHQDILAFL
jgi:trans-aconitate methyltransferase